MADVSTMDDSRRERGDTGAAASRRDDIRLFLAVVAVIAAIGGLGLYLDNRITSLDSSLRGEMREIRADMREINADIREIDDALRDLNTRVGRIEGVLGVVAPGPAVPAE